MTVLFPCAAMTKLLRAVPLAGLALLLPMPALAMDQRFALQTDLDHVWLITASALVLFMQGGFLLLEAGTVRSKNSINVAQKNLIDFVLSTLLFGAVGYMLMFGASWNGWFGVSSTLAWFGPHEPWTLTFFTFQLVFCGTAATIVSGAVAERMTLSGYIVLAAAVGSFIYPISGHWIWGGLLSGDSEGPFLASWGFLDFAGSTVVHGVGAWVGLAGVIILGPRIDKYDEHGHPRRLTGHSPILATLGALILWVGWIGFNGGSTTSGTGDFAAIVMNTMLAAAAGGMTQMVIGRAFSGHFHPEHMINGTLSGLVSVTAGADILSTHAALTIAVFGAAAAFGAARLMEYVMKLDDPLEAVAVHGIAGVVGTIGLAFLAPVEALPAGSRLAQFAVQSAGVAIVFVWAFGCGYAILRVADLVLAGGPDGGRGVRVPEHVEREGLNVHEHGATLGTGVLQTAMAQLALNPDHEAFDIEIDPGDESADLAALFNLIQRNNAGRLAVEREMAERRDQQRNQMITQLKSFQAAVMPRLQAVETATGQMLGQLQILTGLAERTRATATGAADSSRRAGDHVSAVAAEGVTLKESVIEIARSIDLALSRFTEAAGETRAAAEVVDRLRTAGKTVETMAQLIEDLMRQTNLLAMNAKIEAARAGNAGRGFAVVADQVKAFSDQTAQVTDQIRESVEAMEQTVRDVVAASERIRTAVEHGSKATETAARNVHDQGGRVETVAESARGAASQSLSAVEQSEQADRHMQETGRSLDELAEAAREMRDAKEALRTDVEVLIADLLDVAERRLYPRIEAHVSVQIGDEAGKPLGTGDIIDISVGGCAIRTEAMLVWEGLVRLSIEGSGLPVLMGKVLGETEGVWRIAFVARQPQHDLLKSWIASQISSARSRTPAQGRRDAA